MPVCESCESRSGSEHLVWDSEEPLYGGHRHLHLVSQGQGARLRAPWADLPLHLFRLLNL